MQTVPHSPTEGVYAASDDYVHASYAEANAKARVAALGGSAVPTTAIVAQTLVSEWLVEIEVIAAA